VLTRACALSSSRFPCVKRIMLKEPIPAGDDLHLVVFRIAQLLDFSLDRVVAASDTQ
jgi:hypothetical protein